MSNLWEAEEMGISLRGVSSPAKDAPFESHPSIAGRKGFRSFMRRPLGARFSYIPHPRGKEPRAGNASPRQGEDKGDGNFSACADWP